MASLDTTLLWLVFSKLDAKALAVSACVSRPWRLLASQNELWQTLCLSKWPSLRSEPGRRLLLYGAAGSFRRFYALRCQAQLRCRSAPHPALPSPRLQMSDLIFLLDISRGEELVCSVIRSGDMLAPLFVGADIHDGSFRFSTDVITANDFCVTDSDSRICTSSSLVSEKSWSREQVCEFEVSWAIMVSGSAKIFQVLQTNKPGQLIGNICNFSESLPIQFCCSPLIMFSNSHQDRSDCFLAEIQIGFQCSRLPVVSSSGCTFSFSDFKLSNVFFGILNTISWTHVSQAQALTYLQHALLHVCSPTPVSENQGDLGSPQELIAV